MSKLPGRPEAVHPTEMEARIQPVPVEALTPACMRILERIPGAGLKGARFPRNVLGTVMHNPETLETFLDYWVTAKSKMGLSAREQELVILRMACLYSSDYVWKHHLPVGREFGIAQSELAALHAGQIAAFCPREAALLALTDEMVDFRSVSPECWNQHRLSLKERDVVDLISLISQYVFFALMNNVLQVQIEDGVLGEPGLADFG